MCTANKLSISGIALVTALSTTNVSALVDPQPDHSIASSGQHVVINLPQTRLFYYENGKLVKVYPVAVGKAWTKTPPGEYDVRGIFHNPTWNVPVSIQSEMQRSGRTVIKSVPPGPNNPLGPVFIRMGDPKLGLGIHGTNAPSSVPGIRSHGCVRMKSPDALTMSKILQAGTPISVVYQTVLLDQDDAGQLWLTAFKDAYNRKDLDNRMLADALLGWQSARGKAIDGRRVNSALKVRNGKPVCLTCGNPNAQVSGKLSSVRWLPTPPAAAPASTPAQENPTSVSAVKKPAPVKTTAVASGN